MRDKDLENEADKQTDKQAGKQASRQAVRETERHKSRGKCNDVTRKEFNNLKVKRNPTERDRDVGAFDNK